MNTTRWRQTVVPRSPVAPRQELPSPDFGRIQTAALNAMPASRLAERNGYVPRAGVTLTEVLMSLLIMSIGVVSVATLFPIATLRTLEANKQTATTIARFNAESAIDTFVDGIGRPALVHDPDGFFPPTAAADQTPYNGLTFRGQNYLVDPLGWQSFNADNPQPPTPYIAVRDYFGNSAPAGVTWPLPRRYPGASAFLPFANPYPASGTTAVDIAQRAASVARAFQVATQPDNWKLVIESQTIATTPATGITQVTLDNDADLSSITEDINGNGTLDAGEDRDGDGTLDVVLPGHRVTVFDIEGRYSEVRIPTAVGISGTTNTWEIFWTDPLPAQFNGNVGRVRVEVFDPVYTWMLSVRKRPSGATNVDVVVFFKRNFNPQFEIVWPARFIQYRLGTGAITTITGGAGGVPGYPGDDNGINGADDVTEIGYPTNGTNPAEDDQPNGYLPIDFTTIPVGAEPPVLKRGGYAYDTRNGLWYRIRAIESETATSAVLVLDESVKLNGTEDLNLNGVLDPFEDTNGNNALDHGGVILHPSVVNVFPLEIKEP